MEAKGLLFDSGAKAPGRSFFCRGKVSYLVLFRAFGEAGAGHAFAQAALLEKGLFQLAKLLIQEVVGLVDQANEDVGNHFGGAGFQIGPIGLIGPIFLGGEFADE